jgi:hypothetical protein
MQRVLPRGQDTVSDLQARFRGDLFEAIDRESGWIP